MKYASAWHALALLAVMIFCATSWAQTTTPISQPDLNEYAYHVSISGSFSSTSGNATNNGTLTTVQYRVARHWSARCDAYFLANPSSTVGTFCGPQFEEGLRHIIPSNQYINTARLLIFANVKLGSVKGMDGVGHFGGGIGAGVDIPVNKTLHLRVLDVSWLDSSALGRYGKIIGNQAAISAGIGLNF